MASVSVVATVQGWTTEDLLREVLWSRAKYATCSAEQLRTAGWELLPTHAPPHYDIVLPDVTPECAGSLLSVFGALLPNPFKRRKREPMTEKVEAVEIGIPCDVLQIDDTGYVFSFLDEARDPRRITEGAIVVSGDEEDPVLARVVGLTPVSSGVKVNLEILPGDPFDYVEALSRAHLLSA